MKVYRLNAGSIDNLRIEEAPEPKPARGQVLVRMHAASLNYRDLLVATGRYGRGGVPADLVPLSDGAGEVVTAGEAVTRVRPGDRVAGIFMQTWLGGEIDPADPASSLGGAINGVLAEYVLFDQNGLVRMPDHLSFEEAATLPCAAVTAWNAFYGGRPLVAGETVLVLGTGGVSIFALQFAKAAGARVIATSSSQEKLARVRALGAAEEVNYREHPEWGHDFLYHLAGAVGWGIFLLLFEGNFGHNLFRYSWLWYGGFLVIARHCVQERLSAAAWSEMAVYYP